MTDAETPRPDLADVIAPPPLIYLCGLGFGFLLEALFPSASLPGALTLPLGSLLLIAGIWLGGSFFAALREAGTPVTPYSETTALVTAGPYRMSRNPGYLGMTLIYAAVAVLASALWLFLPLAAVLIVVDRGVIAREERYLEQRFGEEYRRYKRRTRRWL